MNRKILAWIPSLLIGGMLALTGATKLLMVPDAQAMFEPLGGTPALLLAGVVELVAAMTILIPATRLLGALLTMATMLGAIGAHLFVLSDDAMLPMAILLLALAAWQGWTSRRQAGIARCFIAIRCRRDQC